MWTLDHRLDVPLWRPDAAVEGASLSFSTRRGGVSEGPYRSLNLGRSTEDRAEAVDENRRRLLLALGLDPERYASAGQVHGSSVRHVREPGLHRSCDILLTTVKNLALVVTSADCLPILLVAPGAVAAAHAGWRGTADGAPRAALSAVCSATGCPPEAVHIHFGPAIRGCCYRVGPEVAARFPRASLRGEGESFWLDLADAARRQLLDAGADPGRIFDTGACTACSPDWYFSHRRDRGLTGRHWGLAALVSPSTGAHAAADGPV